jgi:predicted DNA-binding transcriptional regulator AlpA
MPEHKDKTAKVGKPQPPKLALTVQEFCQSHGIGVTLFYELLKSGSAPRTMRVGGRRLISIEEAQRWREERTTVA